MLGSSFMKLVNRMLYHKFDNGNGCKVYFSNGELLAEISDQHDQTLDFDYENPNAECISLYVDDVKEVLPEYLKEEAEKVKRKREAILKSFRITKVPLNEYCFYENIPDSFIFHMGEIKDEVSRYILENFERPENYNHLLGIKRLTHYISEREINLSIPSNVFEKDILDFRVRVAGKNRIFYDHKGTKTNRFTCRPTSFPILNMSKKFRSYIKPNNDFLLEFDMNAAEIRVALSILGHNVEEVSDIYEWVNKEYFDGKLEREDVKKRLISWLYGKKDSDECLDAYIDKSYFIDNYYDTKNASITTPFGRRIACDEEHAVNYLLQSTSADIVHYAAYRIMDFLVARKAKTRIYFTVHDSVVLDVCKEEKDLMFDCFEIFSNTPLGKFEVNIKKGRNYGDLK